MFFRTARVAILVAAFGAPVFAIDPPKESAPNFNARTLDGDWFTKESVKGKVVLLQFWTTWCPYCKRDQAAVDAVAQYFAGKGLIVLAVDVAESNKKVKQYLQESPRARKVVLTEDTNLAAMYAAKEYPIYVLIDREGYIAGTQNGAISERASRGLLEKARLGAD